MFLRSIRSSAALLAAIIVLAATLFAVTTAKAQSASNDPPTADAGDDYAVTAGVDVTGNLNAVGSFDVEDSTARLTYSWKPITDAYSWVEVVLTGNPRGRTATFDVPPLRLVNRQRVYHIDFELTVTDTDGASDKDIVRVTLNQPPVAAISLTALLPHPNPTDTNNNGMIEDSERYIVDAVIDIPLEGDNDVNDWDITEGARLTLTGSDSTSGEENKQLTYTWQLRASRPNLSGFKIDLFETAQQSITLDLPDTLRANTTAYAQYRLVVTNQSGVSDSALISITLQDKPAAPTVRVSLQNQNQPAQLAYHPDPNQTNQPATFVVAPGQTVRLQATAEDKDGTQTRHLTHLWAPSDNGQNSGQEIALTQVSPTRKGPMSQATYTAPAQLPDDTTSLTQVVTVTVTDNTNRAASVDVTFIVANNQAPEAIAPADIISEDGAQGGVNQSGEVQVVGLGIDSADDTLTYQWRLVDQHGKPLADPEDAPITLINPNSATTSFKTPELSRNLVIHLQLTVTDSWGVFDTDTVMVTIFGLNDPPTANAGTTQQVPTRTAVTLDATGSFDPEPNERLRYSWAYTGLVLNPPASTTPLTTQDRNDLRAFWPTSTQSSGIQYPKVLRAANSVKPFFTTPRFTSLRSVRLIFTLTVTDSANNISQDEVHVVVLGRFFSGDIDGPEFCRNRSLGGPRTYPHDSNKDGVADVCSLRSTRREATARQQALNALASGNIAEFNRQVRQACVTLQGQDYTTQGDKPADLFKDVCATALVAPPPDPPDLTANPMFYSGPTITGPNFCLNLSLGGALTYPHDGDGDGIAETCALPYTRREAVARQIALDTFASSAQFSSSLAIACRVNPATSFPEDKPEDLAEDVCARRTSLDRSGQTGTALPS